MKGEGGRGGDRIRDRDRARGRDRGGDRIRDRDRARGRDRGRDRIRSLGPGTGSGALSPFN